MDEVKIKAHNRDYYVYCSLEHESVFFNMLETKLKACVRGDHTFEAIFCIRQELTSSQMLKLLQCANEHGTLIKGLSLPLKPSAIRIIEEPLFSGQTYCFDEDVMIMGAVSADTFITCSEHMYVLGEVRGNIDLLHEDCKIYASRFTQANIRICDSPYQNVTSFAPAKIYYKDMLLQIKEYKEEKMWDKQLR